MFDLIDKNGEKECPVISFYLERLTTNAEISIKLALCLLSGNRVTMRVSNQRNDRVNMIWGRTTRGWVVVYELFPFQ